MIARVWSGRTRAEDAEDYLRYVAETGMRNQRRTPGNRGSWILRRRLGEEAEFQVISLWESEQHVKAFAGDAPEKAVYYPEDERFLLEMSPEVTHYEVFGAEAFGASGDEHA